MQLKASGILQLQEVSSFFVGVMSSLLDANSNGKQRNNQTETTAAVNLCTHMQLAAFFAIPHCCMLPPFWGVFPQCCESLQAQVQLQHVACATMMSNKHAVADLEWSAIWAGGVSKQRYFCLDWVVTKCCRRAGKTSSALESNGYGWSGKLLLRQKIKYLCNFEKKCLNGY